ncbi:helix-turn-helix domain-containing protein [Frankia sp. AgKG'84/4]|uniref:helix-turn-helix domain-containing protein n=1 Tax=Frankia sp. AgKG'84/4 TaxID=573490 RepID=UPI00200D6916|nr:helix-turn-helix transcriptional regulator [Frankia sp. AgKG'84/4]MCL9793476.1 helix-turn-helix transcriptional regulator [Frankia sp. AgKG'84/4]
MSTANAVVARRRLALGLRQHRLRAGLTLEELAHRMECSPAKISRMETGISGVRLQDLKMIAEVMSLRPADRDMMIALMRQSRNHEWWHEYTDIVPPASATFYGLEDGAPIIRQHSTSLVPGLLQTADYARALITSVDGISADLAERRLALRRRRQLVLGRPDPPRLTVILDEAVLFRVIGGPAVMAEQCMNLLHQAETGQVHVQVVPFDADTHPAEGVAFILFEFEEDGGGPVVFAEQLSRNTFIDENEEVAVYRSAMAGAQRVALTRELSLQAIAERAGMLSGKA